MTSRLFCAIAVATAFIASGCGKTTPDSKDPIILPPEPDPEPDPEPAPEDSGTIVLPEMGHVGISRPVSSNATGTIDGTPWTWELWRESGNGSSKMAVYSNGTFTAEWGPETDYLARVGFYYNSGADLSTKDYVADYRFTRTGSASFGFFGVYGWTKNPFCEYYIVEDWIGNKENLPIGTKLGEFTANGDTYDIHAVLRNNVYTITGEVSNVLQIFSVRKTARKEGRIHISAHFDKWNQLFTGQTASIQGGIAKLEFGKPIMVTLQCETVGNDSGTADFTYFDLSDSGAAGMYATTHSGS